MEKQALLIETAEVTAQSLRAVRKYVDSRGPGEELTEAIAWLCDTLEAGKNVTLIPVDR